MLSSTDIANMKATVDAAMPDSGAVRRVTRTIDSMGGYTEAWSTVVTSACRVDPPSVNPAVLQFYAARLGERQAFVINFPVTTDVQEGDEVVVSSVTYEVLGVLDHGAWELVQQTLVARLG